MLSRKRSAILLAASLCALILSLFLFKKLSRSADRQFEDYTARLFSQEISANTISLHYTLKHPEVYNIDHIPVSLGSVTTDTDALAASVENALALLHSYDRERLSPDNQLTYDVLEYYFNASLKEAPYALYEEPLTPLTGTQSQLPVILSEYRFYTVKDCDIYIELLGKIPEYFHSIIKFEQVKSDAGLFMADYSADSLIEECQAFIRMGSSNYLYSSFEERIKELHLSEKEESIYIEKNKQSIEAYVFPAYAELISALKKLRETGKNKNGLCHLPDGTKYYELTVAAQTGSSRTISELQKLTLTQLSEDAAALHKTLDAVKTPSASSYNAQPSLSEPDKILEELKSSMTDLFPAPPNVNTQIKYVQESMEEYLSPAFYMIPAIDDTQNNVIYINQGHMPDNLTLFTTLAHEGYPGHLYQTVYYASTAPDPVRSILDFGGYTEGWATYSEMMSYYFSSLSKEQAALMQHNTSIILGLYALADMGIHYDGWTLLDTISFFHGYGITDNTAIEEIYNLIIGDPGNYLKYYIGYVEFLELKKEAIKTWGNEFSQKRFHKEILEIGPAPFDILSEYMLGTGDF